jgi:jasmonate ZIM domain-containing protein
VVVFDRFPSAKVKDLLQIVSPPGADAVVDGAGAGAAVPTQNLPRPSHDSLSAGKASAPPSLVLFLLRW